MGFFCEKFELFDQLFSKEIHIKDFCYGMCQYGLTGISDSGICGLVFSPLLYFCSYEYVFK